jgi:hypothetical protein
VLLDERLEHVVGKQAPGVAREERAVAQVAAPAHHRERHGPYTLALAADHDVHVAHLR